MMHCPGTETLEQLLDGALPEEQVSGVRDHLAGCSRCQALVDQLSDDPEMRRRISASWTEAAPDEPALTRVLHQLRAIPPYETPHADTTSEPVPPSLGFLGPPAQEGDLGTLGPYRILAELGRGGMGIVLLGYDSTLRRTVALKVLPPERAEARARARFVREAQAAAGIEHDYVVPVHAVANPADGPPYLVMQYVEGPTLRQRIKAEGRLDPRQAARIAEQVAEGLAAAHRNGLIHRDIKPANIILDSAQGRAKITDFGLVRITSVPGGTTQEGSMLGTPEYMSPEQARAPARIDARTDVYSLGVTLFEALTGETPFRGVPQMVLQQVLNDEPRSPRRLNDAIPHDLETICLKAMAKEASRRYQSAGDLAEDLRRFLAGQPIRARPIQAWERALKWVRRRPAVAALLALVVFVTALGFGLLERARRQAEADKVEIAKQKDIAQANETAAIQREAEAKAVLEFFENRIFAAARPEGQAGGLGHDVSLRRAVEASLPFVEKSFTNQPLVEARLRLTLGTSFWFLGDAKKATEQYEASRALFTQHCGPDHHDTLQSMTNLANSYHDLGRRADALKLREETLALMKAKLGPDHHDTLRSMNNLAISYGDLGRHGDALKLNEETLALMKAKLGPDHPDTLNSMHELATTYHHLGRDADALTLFEETLARTKAKLGPNHPHTLLTMDNLAACYRFVGRHADALTLHQETLALMTTSLGPDHPETLVAMHNLADCYTDLGRHVDALTLYQETLALMKAKLGLDHPESLLSMAGLAGSLVKLDRGAEAVTVIDECVQRAAGKLVDPRVLPEVMDLRLRHFAKTEDAAGCRQTAEMWEKLLVSPDFMPDPKKKQDGNPVPRAANLYTAACMRAVTAAVLKSNPAADAARLAKEEADRAMAWLKQAVAAGYKDAAHMAKDKDLDALRTREDYKRLLTELEKKVDTGNR
jgi:tetratricopeptide (TPR) repeat protein